MPDLIKIVTSEKTAATDWLDAEKARGSYKPSTSAKTRTANALKTSTSWAALVLNARAIVAAADAATPAPPVHGDPAPPVHGDPAPPAHGTPEPPAVEPGATPVPQPGAVPTVSLVSIEVDLGATVARVPIRLTGPAPWNMHVAYVTRNQTAKEGENFSRLEGIAIFNVGDNGLEQYAEIPLNVGKAQAGLTFDLCFGSSPSGVSKTIPNQDCATITYRAGAPAVVAAPYVKRASPMPALGKLLDAYDPATFASRIKRGGGRGLIDNRFKTDDATQDGNSEDVIYTPEEENPGAKPSSFVDKATGLLHLTVQKGPFTHTNPWGVKATRNFGASVLRFTDSPFLYGDVIMEGYWPGAPGTWGGDWTLPADGSWPPEGDWGGESYNGKSDWDEGDIEINNHSPGGANMPFRVRGKQIFRDRNFSMTRQKTRSRWSWRKDFVTRWLNDVEVYKVPNTINVPMYALLDNTIQPGWTPDFNHPELDLRIAKYEIYAAP